jgi:pimeloyl-ACP methyl ester carboxylesterase
MHNPKLRRWLHRIGVPTLVLRGAQDGLVSGAYAQVMADAIPGARLETIAGAGHVPEFEQPQILAERVQRFLGLVGA